MKDLKRQEYLTNLLSDAAYHYYQTDNEIMSNKEYDDLYDELLKLEKENNTVLSGSPTQQVGYEVLSELPKIEHATPQLSLDKTKNPDELAKLLVDDRENHYKGLLSIKLDGLTVVLTYENGKLSRAVTRGNGLVGELITENAKCFKKLPLQIDYKERLVLRGEALITYSQFEEINQGLSDDAKYKNPRNLCSGSVRQLDPKVTKERGVNLVAFSLQEPSFNTHSEELNFLESLGFTVVPHFEVEYNNLKEYIEKMEKEVKKSDFPSDGLVLLLDDVKYGNSLGTTAKFPRNAMAFKWADETATTKITDILWNTSRTGRINPIAIFNPVELEGTTVKRASLHNISILKELKIGIGDEIEVYKANMIIPQVLKNLTESNNYIIPNTCPVCANQAVIERNDDVEVLYCTNPQCPAKQLNSFVLFVSRNAMNIEGLAKETLEDFIQKRFLKDFSDIYKLYEHKDEIIAMEGYGEKSYEKLINNIDASKNVELNNFITALGIPNVGSANSKALSKKYESIDLLMNADIEELTEIDGIGNIMAEEIVKYFSNDNNIAIINELKNILHITNNISTDSSLNGITFVITGSLNNFENRDALKTRLEEMGAKVTGSVTSKTSFLINNDITSNSGKNKKAKELNIPIITEEEVIKKFKL